MDSEKPIGVFDSGVGGLSVVREILQQLPEERIIYFGDTAHVPYGPRTAEEIILFSEQITSFLIQKQVKMIIIACNTSSSLSLDYLQSQYSLPFVDVIYPSLDVAILHTRNKKVGVIGTIATIKSEAHKKLLLKRNEIMEVHGKACPKLVPLVEKGITEGKEVREAVREYILPLTEEGIDTLILGCTHYPFLEKTISEVIGKDIRLIDPAMETVKQAKNYLEAHNLLNDKKRENHEFWVSGDPEEFLAIGRQFMGEVIDKVEKITLD